VREDDDREAGAVEDESTRVTSRSAGGRDEREFSEREPEIAQHAWRP
jgi:hypothetical protein